jgi:transposase
VRGINEPQGLMFHCFSLDSRVPQDHPLRTVKEHTDAILNDLSEVFERMYSTTGRPSVPPERLLKAQLLIALFSIRSDRLFCEMLDYNILYRWFLDMNLEEESWDASTFTKNRDRLLEHDVARQFFEAVVKVAKAKQLLSDEHFTVDGTLIEAWASMKSFRPKDEDPSNRPRTDDDRSNPSVDFHGEKRCNETHRSTTDPEALLMKKGKGKEAKLCFGAHALMENRNGILVDFIVTPATGNSERTAVPIMLDRQKRKGLRPRTIGADKGYDTRDFIKELRDRKITPHVAMNALRRGGSAIDGRTSRHEGYTISQRLRKKVEEIFGWMKVVGGFRRTRFKGVRRTELQGLFVGAAYNLVRISRLLTLQTATP